MMDVEWRVPEKTEQPVIKAPKEASHDGAGPVGVWVWVLAEVEAEAEAEAEIVSIVAKWTKRIVDKDVVARQLSERGSSEECQRVKARGSTLGAFERGYGKIGDGRVQVQKRGGFGGMG